jgi:sulfatase modifying factor 1
MTNYVFSSDLTYMSYLQNRQEEAGSNQAYLDIVQTTLDLIADEKCLNEHNIRIIKQDSGKFTHGEQPVVRLSYQPSEYKTKHAELPADFSWGRANRIIQTGHVQDEIKQIFPQPDNPEHIYAFPRFAKALEYFRKDDYTSALFEVLAAINGDNALKGYKKEWRFHFLAGIIHLGFAGCNIALVNLEEAEKDFLRASKLSLAEYPAESSISLLAAGWATYCHGKMEDAERYVSEAIKQNNKLNEAYYVMGKVCLAQGKVVEGMNQLFGAISRDVFFALKAASDESYTSHGNELRALLAEWKKSKLEGFRTEITEDVFSYNATGIGKELKSLLDGYASTMHLLDIGKIETEWTRYKSIPIFVSKPIEKLKIEIETLVKVVEPYKEKVIIREKSWFRKEEAKIITKTRVAEKMKRIRFEVNIFRDMFMFLTGKVLAEYDMVQVEGGKFSMGDTAGVGRNDERPIQEVELDTFLICKTQVTQKLWNLVLGTTPSNFHGYELPVEHINWFDCIEFCNKLSTMADLEPCYTIDKETKNAGGLSKTDPSRWIITCNWNANGYRLPTEAEWEYSAKGGKNSNFYNYSGGEAEGPVAWHKNNSQYKTQNVGQKKPNELGLHDMSGNVWEWCWDWHTAYQETLLKNPRGPETGNYRTLRGGSWADNLNYQRVASRGKESPNGKYSSIGMRLVRNSR